MPTEVAAGRVDEFVGGERDPASFRGHSDFTFLRGADGADRAGSRLTSWEKPFSKPVERVRVSAIFAASDMLSSYPLTQKSCSVGSHRGRE